MSLCIFVMIFKVQKVTLCFSLFLQVSLCLFLLPDIRGNDGIFLSCLKFHRRQLLLFFFEKCTENWNVWTYFKKKKYIYWQKCQRLLLLIFFCTACKLKKFGLFQSQHSYCYYLVFYKKAWQKEPKSILVFYFRKKIYCYAACLHLYKIHSSKSSSRCFTFFTFFKGFQRKKKRFKKKHCIFLFLYIVWSGVFFV